MVADAYVTLPSCDWSATRTHFAPVLVMFFHIRLHRSFPLAYPAGSACGDRSGYQGALDRYSIAKHQ